jgi:2-iminobutanoate/2-iminopropanoate deaminase
MAAHVRLAFIAAAAAAAAAAVLPAQTAPPAFAPVSARGGLMFVSGILPPAPAAGDAAAQTAQVLAELKARLERAGTSMDRVLSATDYLAEMQDFPALNGVWRKYWPAAPPARTTLAAKLPRAGARVQVSAVAAAREGERVVVLPAGWPGPANPYSAAVRYGDVIFVSGQVSRRGADNAIVQGEIEAQTSTVIDNAEAILKAGGFSLADVVSSRVFLTDTALFERMNAVYRARFPVNPPARATVIAPLVAPEFFIELTVVAARSPARVAVLTPNADGSPGRPNPNLSSAIKAGPWLFLSGMLGVLPGNAADAAGQTRETIGRLERTMSAAGFGWADVAESVVYVTDLASAPDVLRVMSERAGGSLPAGTLVGTGLVAADGRVEIMLTASK